MSPLVQSEEDVRIMQLQRELEKQGRMEYVLPNDKRPEPNIEYFITDKGNWIHHTKVNKFHHWKCMHDIPLNWSCPACNGPTKVIREKEDE